MNQRALVALRCLVQLLGACALLVAAMAGAQLIASASADAQESVINTPVLTARDGASVGSVTFTWTTDDRAVEYEVAAGPGTTCVVQVRSLATCTAVAGSDVCIAVQGKDASGIQGLASDWMCVTDDPLLVQADSSYVGEQFQMGLVPKDEAVPSSVGADDCIVDLSYYPSRYLCLSEGGLDNALAVMAEAVADNPVGEEADTRVFWIGKGGEIPVEDFGPAELGADVRFLETLVDGDRAPGETVTYRVEVVNVGPLPADAVGYQFRIHPNYVLASASGEDCVRVGSFLHCFVGVVGDLADEVVYSVTFRSDISEAEARQTTHEAVGSDGNVSKPGSLPEDETVVGASGAWIPGANAPCGADGGPPTVWQFRAATGGDVRLVRLSEDQQREALAALAGQPRPEGCDEVSGRVFSNVVAPPRPGDPQAAGWGDPHLITFDRLRYDFQGAGEYVLARSTVDDFVIHSRFFRANGTLLSWLHSYAAKVGNSVVTFNDDASLALRDPSVVAVDGVVVDVTSTPTPIDGGAGSLTRLANGDLELVWADGSILTVGSTVGSPYKITVAPQRWGLLEGLSGDADGDTSNDLRSADDTPFVFASAELYSIFGESWSVQPEDSLFVNELNFTAVNPQNPTALISFEDFSAGILAQAEAACRAAGIQPGPGFAECVLDLAATQDVAWLPNFDFLGEVLNGSVEALVRLGLLEDDVAITVPTVATGEISVSRAVDVYRFDLEADSVLEINAFGGCPETRSFRFVLEAPSGDLIARSGGFACGRIGVFGLPETGEYKLHVYDDFGATGAYELSITLPESSLRSYQLDTTATGSIDPGGEVFQVFTIVEDDTEIFYDNLSCSSSIGLELIDETGAVVYASGCGQDRIHFLDAGVWSFRLYSTNGNGGTYSFFVLETPERLVADLALNEAVAGNLQFRTDEHTFNLTIEQDGTQVYFDNISCFVDGRTRWELTSADGTRVFESGCNGEHLRTLDAGVWSLRIYNTSFAAARYSFRTWEILPPQEFDLVVGDFYGDTLDFPRDQHIYTFNIEADNTELFFEGGTCSNDGRMRWDLTSPSGQVRFSDWCRNDFPVLAEAGEWTLRVFGTGSTRGAYTFRVWAIPERPTFDLVLGEPVANSLDFPNFSHTYQFTVDADATNLIFDSGQCANNGLMFWKLSRAGETQTVFNDWCRFDKAATVDAGDWELQVFSNGTTRGAYSFEVREQ